MSASTAVMEPSSEPARLRVLFVMNTLRVGGAEKQVLTLLHTLDTQRFTLGLVYLRDEGELLPQIPADRVSYVACSRAQRYIDLRGLKRLRTQIDTFAPDIVVCTNSWSLLNVSLARPFARHRFRLVEVFHTTTLITFKQRLQMRMHHPLFARSDLLVYVCNTQRDFWRRQGLEARADTVVYNGIDAQRFTDAWSAGDKLALRKQLGFATNDYVVGLCAVFRREKAHGDLLAAVAGLRAVGIPAKALLIGDGPYRAFIEAEIRRLDLAEHVHVTGYLDDVRPYVAICDVMTLVSHAIETFSIAALEAMAMGKAMILTRIGGAEELVQEGQTGLLYPPGDIGALSRHLTALFDPDLRSRLGLAARNYVYQRFTTERMTQEFTACLARVANGQSRSGDDAAAVRNRRLEAKARSAPLQP